MGATPLGLGYPEPTDLLTNAHASIRTLAEGVDSIISPDSATIQPAESPGSVGGATTVDFPGAQALGHFTYSAGVLTYTGPRPRQFMVATSVEIEQGGSAVIDSVVEVVVNGVSVMGSYDLIDLAPTVLNVRKRVHTIAVPVQLAPGDTVAAVANANPAGTLGVTALRVWAIGPVLA